VVSRVNSKNPGWVVAHSNQPKHDSVAGAPADIHVMLHRINPRANIHEPKHECRPCGHDSVDRRLKAQLSDLRVVLLGEPLKEQLAQEFFVAEVQARELSKTVFRTSDPESSRTCSSRLPRCTLYHRSI